MLKKNNYIRERFFVIAIVLTVFLFQDKFFIAEAIIPTQERIDKCQKLLKQENVSEEDLKNLDKCKRILDAKVESTTQRKSILENQVKLYNLKVTHAAQNLNKVEEQLKRHEDQLRAIEEDLKEKNTSINDLKQQLKNSIVLYKHNKENFELNLLNSESNLTTWMNRSEYLNKLAKNINTKLIKLKQDKKIVLEQREKLLETKDKIKKDRASLLETKRNLEAQKRIKDDFLMKTAGDEKKYKEMLARIEKQKKSIVNFSSFSNATKGTVADIKRNAKKPKDGLASTSWYYAQDNPKWGNKTIGFSRTLMKDYGCAITALSMVFTKEKENINPGKLAKKPLFYQDLIVWPNSWGKLRLKYGRTHGNLNWGIIDKQLRKKKPVIVFIRSRSGAGHYVVIHHKDKNGRYVVHDPLFGPNIYLDTSKKIISALYKSGVRIDQMLVYE